MLAARTIFRGVRHITKYTKSHEYIKVDGAVGTVGITNYAQSALGDVVYVGVPDVGAVYKKGASFASVESVKAASDVYIPVAGTVKEVNKKLGDDPSLVNKSAEGDAWFAKVTIANPKDLDSLLDDAAYKAFLKSEGH